MRIIVGSDNGLVKGRDSFFFFSSLPIGNLSYSIWSDSWVFPFFFKYLGISAEHKNVFQYWGTQSPTSTIDFLSWGLPNPSSSSLESIERELVIATRTKPPKKPANPTDNTTAIVNTPVTSQIQIWNIDYKDNNNRSNKNSRFQYQSPPQVVSQMKVDFRYQGTVRGLNILPSDEEKR